MLRLAIDTGGTFTDCVLSDTASGTAWLYKVLSTPDAPERAVLGGVSGLQGQHPFELASIAEVLIATTARKKRGRI